MAHIYSVCINPDAGMPKHEQRFVRVGEFGLTGDYHCREMRPSFSAPGTTKPNVDRHISLVALEVILDVRRSLGITLPLGALGENIVTDGLGDLSQLKDGTRLRVGRSSVILRVVEQMTPCRNLYPIHRLLVKRIYGRRGVYCAIEEGIGSMVRPGDAIRILG